MDLFDYVAKQVEDTYDEVSKQVEETYDEVSKEVEKQYDDVVKLGGEVYDDYQSGKLQKDVENLAIGTYQTVIDNVPTIKTELDKMPEKEALMTGVWYCEQPLFEDAPIIDIPLLKDYNLQFHHSACKIHGKTFTNAFINDSDLMTIVEVENDEKFSWSYLGEAQRSLEEMYILIGEFTGQKLTYHILARNCQDISNGLIDYALGKISKEQFFEKVNEKTKFVEDVEKYLEDAYNEVEKFGTDVYNYVAQGVEDISKQINK